MRRGGCVSAALLIIVALVLAAGGFYYWSTRSDDFSSGSMVTAFQRQNELTVFAAQVVAIPTTTVKGLIFTRSQTTIIPAKVRYTVELSGLSDKDVSWDAAAKVLRVTVPPVAVQPPELDVTRKRSFRMGPPAAAATWDAFDRSNAIKGSREAKQLASSPELIKLAEAGAREAIAGSAAVILRATGQRDARVAVRFATEGGGYRRWDESARPEEVVARP